MRKRKLKKFIALILAFVMLFSLGGNVVSANVSDEITEKSLDQVQRENEAKLLERKVSDETKAFSPGDDYSLDNNAVEMFDLPNNTPKINMEGIPKIKSKSKVRKENDEQRYNVLVLDTSASSSFLDSSGNIFYTADTAIDYVKASAKKFIEGVQKADGTNYVAIVEYKGSTANVVSEFSTDFVSLNAAIDGLYASQNTRNVAAGLQKADTLINEISNPKAIKNVVLFTTGMTNDGEYSYDGHYNEDTIGSEWRRSDTQVRLYAYSNAAYAMAETLKSKATVYSVGLFQMMENMPEEGLEIVQFFKLFSSELATSLEHFYDVKDPNDLEFIFGEIADKVTTKDVNFYFASGEEKDYEAVCHYSDNYFRKASCGTRQLDGYNHSLSTASLCLALSAFGSNDGGNSDYTNKYKNVEKLLTDLEFEEFDKNDWFVKKPQSDSIGVVAANKKLSIDDKECTLMAVAVRGGGNESEWAGNFTLGKSGQHYGFAQAKKQVLDFLKSYIRENKISGDIKIWLTGYSRAAATANLVAGALDDGEKLGDGVVLKKEDLYAYCFETPMGATKSEIKNRLKYNNIYNIINKNDPVTKVAMFVLDFTRFGGDYFLPDKISDGNNYAAKKNAMEQFYDKMSSKNEIGKYAVDDFVMKKIDVKYLLPGGKSPVQNDENNKSIQAEYLDTTINKLTKERVKTRDNYVKELQNGIRTIFTVKYGTMFPDQPIQRINKFFDLFLEKLCSVDTLGEIVIAALNPHPDASVKKVIEDVMEEALNEAGINNYSPSALKEFAGAVAEMLVIFVVSHPNLTVTGVSNAKTLGAAHYPELCMAWLMSQDENYTSSPTEFDGNGNYRVIHINCPIDVEVYDSENILQARIVDDIPQEIKNGTVVASLNEDDEKIVYLPTNASYQIKLTATDNGTMNYSINEFSSTAGDITRVVNYKDINLNKNDVFNAVVPAYVDDEQNNEIEGSTTEYELKSPDGKEINPDQNLSGEDAKSAYYMVTVEVDSDEHGIAIGQGIRQEGNFAKVEAVAKEGYQFVGWYENDKLISQETQYRFCVEKDTLLVAKFEKDGESANLENPANPENPDSGKDNNTGNNSGSGINENGGEKIESVSTGDESAVGFCSLMAVIMVSIVMCMAFTKIRRKKQRN